MTTTQVATVSSHKGIILVAGACIGGGMLAMPIQMANAGFLVSALVLLLSWAFMTFTGCLLVEATLWLKDRAHFSSLAQTLLGPFGKALSLAVYLFMNSASLVAYTSGGALLLDHWLSIGYTAGTLLFTLVFGSCVYFGVSFISKINGWFAILMMALFACLVGSIFLSIQPTHLNTSLSWHAGLNAFPIALAAFSYQMIVPSLCSYLNYEPQALRRSILLGTSIPFAVYFLWVFAIQGAIPQDVLARTTMIIEPIKAHLPWIAPVADSFAFLALVPSFFGLSIALFDFVRDLAKPRFPNPHQGVITILSLVPCLAIALLCPNALLDCLDMSGGFGDALLSGLIPVAMVWIGRYRMNLSGDFTAPGGKPALLAAAFMAASIFCIQWMKLL